MSPPCFPVTAHVPVASAHMGGCRRKHGKGRTGKGCPTPSRGKSREGKASTRVPVSNDNTPTTNGGGLRPDSRVRPVSQRGPGRPSDPVRPGRGLPAGGKEAFNN